MLKKEINIKINNLSTTSIPTPKGKKTPMLEKSTLQTCLNCCTSQNTACVLNVNLDLLYFNICLLLITIHVTLDSLITTFKLRKHYE